MSYKDRYNRKHSITLCFNDEEFAQVEELASMLKKPRATATARSERKRDIEQINQQQQFINRRVEEIRRTQQQIGKSLDSTEERIGRNRRALHSIVSTVRRYIRTFSAYSRKNQNKRYFEEKRRIEEEKQFTQRRRKKFIY